MNRNDEIEAALVRVEATLYRAACSLDQQPDADAQQANECRSVAAEVAALRAALAAPAPTDKVREAAGALCDYLDETSGGAEWMGAPLVRRLRAALDAPSGGDATPRDEAGGTLPTRGDVGRPEATRDPVFLLRYRHRGDKPARNRWHVDSVWFTREEAEAFGNNHAHRWGKDKSGPRWQVYCVPAGGDLAALLKARTLVPQKGGAR